MILVTNNSVEYAKQELILIGLEETDVFEPYQALIQHLLLTYESIN